MLGITLITGGPSMLLRWDLRAALEHQRASWILGAHEWSTLVFSSHSALWPALGSALEMSRGVEPRAKVRVS